jgi:hypothetical protein
MAETITDDGEIIDSKLPVLQDEGGTLSVIARVELDSAIATAKAYPRDMHSAIADIMTLATLDEETAAEAAYALPRAGKPIKGASIRLAEIVASQWGNNRSMARIVKIDHENKLVITEGVYIDLQKNSTISKQSSRSIVDRRGRLYSDDMISMTLNAAQAIALRNAIFTGIPKAVWGKAYAACQQIVKGDVKTLVERRDRAIKAFAQFGVKPEQIYGALQVKGIEDLTVEHMPLLQGMHTALKNEETTVEEMFDPRKTGSTHEPVLNPLKDDPAPQQAAPKPDDKKSEPKLDFFKAGAEAHKMGVPRDRPPGDLRVLNRAADLLQWCEGWDSANA